MSSLKAEFSSFEREYLKELLISPINVLESKRTDTDFKKKKAELWSRVADMLNSSPQIQHVSMNVLHTYLIVYYCLTFLFLFLLIDIFKAQFKLNIKVTFFIKTRLLVSS